MQGSYVLPFFFMGALFAQDMVELRDPGEALRVQPFRQWMPKRQPHSYFVSPKSQPVPKVPAASNGPCSIPLLTIKPKATDQAMIVPVPKSSGNMPQVSVPAPACEDWLPK